MLLESKQNNPKQINRREFIKQLVIYLATLIFVGSSNRLVVKVPETISGEDLEEKKKAELEKKAIYFAGNVGTHLYLVMEYIDTLSDAAELVKDNFGEKDGVMRSLEDFEESEFWEILGISKMEEENVEIMALFLKDFFEKTDGQDFKKKRVTGIVETYLEKEYMMANGEHSTDASVKDVSLLLHVILSDFNLFMLLTRDPSIKKVEDVDYGGNFIFPGKLNLPYSKQYENISEMTTYEKTALLVYCLLYNRKFKNKKT